MTITLLIQNLKCFGNNENVIFSFEPTTAQLYQKNIGVSASIEMKLNVVYSVTTVITEFVNVQHIGKSAKSTYI